MQEHNETQFACVNVGLFAVVGWLQKWAAIVTEGPGVQCRARARACVCMYAGTYVRVYAYVRKYVRVYVCVRNCVCIRTYGCVCIRMCVSLYAPAAVLYCVA
jgi:hypothetical protein